MHVRYHLFVAAGLVGLLLLSTTAMAAPDDVDHADPTVKDGSYSMTEVYVSVGMAMAAAFTAAVSILGAGAAVGKIGSAALGSAAELRLQVEEGWRRVLLCFSREWAQ